MVWVRTLPPFRAIRDEGKYGIPRYTLLLRTIHDYSDYDSGMVPPRNKPILKGFARIWFWDIACVQSPFDRCWCRHLTILTRCRLNPRVFARVLDGSSPPCARQHQCEGPMSPNRHLVQLREPRCFFCGILNSMIRLCGSGGYGCVQVPGKAFLPFGAAGRKKSISSKPATADRQNFAQLKVYHCSWAVATCFLKRSRVSTVSIETPLQETCNVEVGAGWHDDMPKKTI